MFAGADLIDSVTKFILYQSGPNMFDEKPERTPKIKVKQSLQQIHKTRVNCLKLLVKVKIPTSIKSNQIKHNL